MLPKRKTLSLLIAFFLTCNSSGLPVYGQEVAISDEVKFWVSRSISDYFMGYFTPVDPVTKHNFRVCGLTWKSRFVDVKDVVEAKWTTECTPSSGPYSVYTAAEFVAASEDQPVFDLSGRLIGDVSKIIVDQKGGIAGYIVEYQTDMGTSYGLILASKVSAWSAAEGVSFLSESNPTIVVEIEEMGANWLTPEVESALQEIGFQPGGVLDFREAIESGTVPFGTVRAFAPELWLDLK